MKRLLTSILLCCVISVVMADSAEYYKLNPQKLEQALALCPEKHPHDMTCDELANVRNSVNRLVAELQMSPQSYGLSIMTLQSTLAEQITQQRRHSSSQLQQQIAQTQRVLRERLSIIKWLESPQKHKWFHDENLG